MARYEYLKQKAQEEKKARKVEFSKKSRYDQLRAKALSDKSTAIAKELNQFQQKAATGAYMTKEELEQYQSNVLSYIEAGSNFRSAMKKIGHEANQTEDGRWQKTMAQLSTSVGKYFDMYSGYDSQEAWDTAWTATQKEKQEKAAMLEENPAELATEIAWLKDLNDQLAGLVREYTGMYDAVKAHQALPEASDYSEDEIVGFRQTMQEMEKKYGLTQRELLGWDSPDLKIEEKEKYLKNVNDLQTLRGLETSVTERDDFDEISQYDESKYTPPPNLEDLDPDEVVSVSPYTRYAAINGDPEARREILYYSQEDAWMEMTPEQVSIYNALESAYGLEKADQYYELLKSDLYAKQRGKIQQASEKFAKEHSFAADLTSVMMAPYKGLAYGKQVADYLYDGDINENDPYNVVLHASSDIRNTRAGMVEEDWKKFFSDKVSPEAAANWGKVGSWGYQLGMGLGDFVATTAVSGGSQPLALAIMGTGAAADMTISAKSRGLSDGQALLLGTIAGAAEIFTEKIGMDALFDAALRGKSPLVYLLKNALSEGLEEPTSSLINTMADLIISGDKAELAQAAQQYIDDDVDPKQAWGKALGDYALSLGLDAIGGFLSGTTLGGSSIAVDYVTSAIAKNTVSQPQSDTPFLNAGEAQDMLPGEVRAPAATPKGETNADAVSGMESDETRTTDTSIPGQFSERNGAILAKSANGASVEQLLNGIDTKTLDPRALKAVQTYQNQLQQRDTMVTQLEGKRETLQKLQAQQKAQQNDAPSLTEDLRTAELSPDPKSRKDRIRQLFWQKQQSKTNLEQQISKTEAEIATLEKMLAAQQQKLNTTAQSSVLQQAAQKAHAQLAAQQQMQGQEQNVKNGRKKNLDNFSQDDILSVEQLDDFGTEEKDKAEARRKKRVDTMNQNRRRGRDAERLLEAVFDHVLKDLRTQITIQVEGTEVRFRADAIGYELTESGEKRLKILEFKSSTKARLTKNQKTAFELLKSKDGIVVGRNKKGMLYGGGFVIPAGTQIEVIKLDKGGKWYVSDRYGQG